MLRGARIGELWDRSGAEATFERCGVHANPGGGGRGRADDIILEDEVVKRLARGTVENDVELARMDVCVIKYRVWGKVSWGKRNVLK